MLPADNHQAKSIDFHPNQLRADRRGAILTQNQELTPMGNAFTTRRRHARRPPICIKPPYEGEYPPLDPAWQWVQRSTLPPIPKPPFDKIVVRNLAYHVYAQPGNQEWLRNLHQLLRRWNLFNGRRVIAISTAPGLIPPNTVKNLLGDGPEYMLFPNNPRLREAATFLDLLRSVHSTATNEATFYAHTKGCSEHHDRQQDKQLAIRYWRNRMYSELLDRWPGNGLTLQKYPAIGCYKIDYSRDPDSEMTSPTGLEWGTWHFAGSFCWFRHDRIFRDPNWSAIADDPFAVEMWLGKLLDSREGKSIYQPFDPYDHPTPNLYDPSAHYDPKDDGRATRPPKSFSRKPSPSNTYQDLQK